MDLSRTAIAFLGVLTGETNNGITGRNSHSFLVHTFHVRVKGALYGNNEITCGNSYSTLNE